MTTYEPGTVAVAAYCGEPNVRVSRYGHGWARLANPDDFINDDEAMGTYTVTDVRPLVVIDPDDREQVERLLGYYVAPFDDFVTDGRLDHMQAALREFANPTPPRPEEPTGLGAVVEDAEGKRWVRTGDSGQDDWREAGFNSGQLGRWYHYADIAAVRVLSSGVTA